MHVVHWQKKATADLAAICLDHLTMWPIIDAVDQDIGRKLERHPLKYSQEVSEGMRRICGKASRQRHASLARAANDLPPSK